jgi:hypothetical protein
MLLSLDADAMRLLCKGDVEYVGEIDLLLNACFHIGFFSLLLTVTCLLDEQYLICFALTPGSGFLMYELCPSGLCSSPLK